MLTLLLFLSVRLCFACWLRRTCSSRSVLELGKGDTGVKALTQSVGMGLGWVQIEEPSQFMENWCYDKASPQPPPYLPFCCPRLKGEASRGRLAQLPRLTAFRTIAVSKVLTSKDLI